MQNNYQNLLSQYPTELHYVRPIKITIKDKRIIAELFKNSRISLGRIAKKTQLSRQSVDYRIKRMIKLGFLQGFSTMINFSKLGYTFYLSLLYLDKFDEELERKMSKFIKEESSIIKSTKYAGKWNILIESLHIKNKEFHDFFKKIKNICANNLTKFEICQGIKQYKHITLPLEYLKPVKIKNNQLCYGQIDNTSKVIKINNIDYTILVNLAKNSRLDLSDVLNQKYLKPDAIRNRIERLKEAGIIKGFMPIINPTGLKVQWHELYFRLINNITEKQERKFIYYLQNHPLVGYVLKIGENYDYRIYLWVRSQEEFSKFITDLKNNLSELIINFDYLYGLKEYKYQEFLSEKNSGS
jgi:DNA-binding Lrp family transcriptional regulator